jgi:hypothetical protein
MPSKALYQPTESLAACRDAWLFLVNDLDRIDTIAHRAWASVIL